VAEKGGLRLFSPGTSIGTKTTISTIPQMEVEKPRVTSTANDVFLYFTGIITTASLPPTAKITSLD
jgi:hypothetical protein